MVQLCASTETKVTTGVGGIVVATGVTVVGVRDAQPAKRMAAMQRRRMNRVFLSILQN
jgi:hypothetical protein